MKHVVYFLLLAAIEFSQSGRDTIIEYLDSTNLLAKTRFQDTRPRYMFVALIDASFDDYSAGRDSPRCCNRDITHRGIPQSLGDDVYHRRLQSIKASLNNGNRRHFAFDHRPGFRHLHHTTLDRRATDIN